MREASGGEKGLTPLSLLWGFLRHMVSLDLYAVAPGFRSAAIAPGFWAFQIAASVRLPPPFLVGG